MTFHYIVVEDNMTIPAQAHFCRWTTRTMKPGFSLKILFGLLTICALGVAWRADHLQLTSQIQTLQFGQHVDALTTDLRAPGNHLKRARTANRIGIIAAEDHSLFGSPEVIIGYAPALIDALSDSECKVAMQALRSLEIIAARMGSPRSDGPFVFPVPDSIIQSWENWHTVNSR